MNFWLENRILRRFLLLGVLVVLCCGIGNIIFAQSKAPASSGDSDSEEESTWKKAPVRRILIFSTFHSTHPWSASFLNEFIRRLDQRDDYVLTDFVELNSIRMRNEDFQEKFNLYLPKIQAGKFDAVVAILDDAIGLVLEHYDELPPDLPIVFGGFQTWTEDFKTTHPNITGSYSSHDVLNTATLGKTLFPQTRKIVFVTDALPSGVQLNRQILQYSDSLPGVKIETISGTNFNTQEMLHEVGTLGSDSLVVFCPWRTFAMDGYPTLEAVADQLRKVHPHPFLCINDVLLEHGALGGYVSRGESQGRLAGELMNRILNGEVVQTIPFLQYFPEPIIDCQVAKQSGASMKHLPVDVIYLNRIPGIWEVNRSACIGIGVAIVALLVILLLVFLNHVRFRTFTQKIRAVFEQLPISVFVANRHGDFIFQHIDGQPGTTPKKQYRTLDSLPYSNLAEIKTLFHRIFEGSEKELKSEYQRGDQTRLAAFRRLDPKIFGQECVIWVSQDVSALRAAEQERRIWEERDRIILNSIGDGLIATDAQGRVTHMNPVAERLTGYALAEAKGKLEAEIFRIVNYDTGEAVVSPSMRAITQGCIVELANHTDLIHRDGSRRHIADSAAPLLDRGKIIGAVLVFRDVTEEYNHRDQLRLSFELMNQACSQANLSFFRYHLQTGMVSALGSRMLRFWPEENGRQIPLFQWLTRESFVRLSLLLDKIRSGESDTLHCQVESRYGGELHYYLVTARRLTSDIWSGSTGMELFGIIHDVTSLRDSETQCQDTMTMLQSIMDNIPFPIYTKDVEDQFRYLTANSAFCSKLELPLDQILGKQDVDVFQFPEDAERMRHNDEQVLSHGGALENFSEVCKFPDFSTFYGHSFKQIIELSGGKKVLLGVSIDVTQEELAKQKAENAHRILQTILDFLPVGVMAKNVNDDFRYVLWNRVCEESFGVSQEQMIGKTDFEIPAFQSIANEIREQDRKILNAKPNSVVQDRMNVPAGGIGGKAQEATSFDTYQSVVKVGESQTLLLHLSMDVTRQANLERERMDMIARLNNHVENAQLVNRCLEEISISEDFRHSVDMVLEQIGHAMSADRCCVFRANSEGLVSEFEWVRSRAFAVGREGRRRMAWSLFPEWRARFEANEFICLENAEMFPEALRQNKDFHTLKSLFAVGIFRDGRLYGVLGMDFLVNPRLMTDSDKQSLRDAVNLYLIALRRNQQSNLIAREVKLRAQIFDTLDTPVVMLDENRRLVAMNRSCATLLNLDPIKCVGSECGDYFCKQKNSKVCSSTYCPFLKTLATKAPAELFWELNGRSLNLHTQPIFDVNGKLLYILESVMDVTEERNRQALLEKQSRELARFNRELQLYVAQDKTINSCMEMLVFENDISLAMKELTEKIGKQLNAVCCSIFQRQEQVHGTKYLLRGVYQGKVLSGDRFKYQEIPESLHPEFFQALQAQHKLHMLLPVGDGELLALEPAQIAQQQSWQQELGDFMRRFQDAEYLAIAVFVRTRFWGFISVESSPEEREYGSAGERMMESAARVIEVLLEREEHRKTLRQLEDEKQMILNMLPLPILLFDSNRVVRNSNPAARRVLWGSPDELSGASERLCCCCEHCTAQEVEPSAWCPLVTTLHSGKLASGERMVHGKSYMVNTLPIFEEGNLVKVLVSMIDMTEINKSKELLREAAARAEEAARAKSMFLATMSHEIRTPLNAVVGFSELLQDDQIPEQERKEYLQSINFAGNALLHLINDILDLSKIEADQMTLVLQDCDFAALLKELVAVFQYKAAEKNLILILKNPPHSPRLYVDEKRMRQILLNLIGNAVKFTESGSVTVTWSLKEFEEAQKTATLVLEVQDTGIGVAPENREKIFEPFVQENGIRGTRLEQGTGLGLPIARRLVKAMGGCLELRDNESAGKGSCFCIEIPNMRYLPGINLTNGDQNAKREATLVAQPDFSGCRVMIVDDVKLNLRVLNAMLQRLHCECCSCESASQALEQIAKFQPQWVLTDLWMPEMNGQELARRIRENPAYDALRVVAVTADTESDRAFAMNDFYAVLQKPLSIEALRDLLSRK